MRKKQWWYVAGVLVAAVGGYWLGGGLTSAPETAGGPGGMGGPGGVGGPTVVAVASVEQGGFAVRREFVGTLQGIATAELFAKTSGPVTALYANTGDRVRAGQVLAVIDDAAAREAVRQAQAALQIAEANREQREAALRVARTEAARTQQLFDKKLVAEQEQESMQATLASAQAQLRLAEAQIEQARANLSSANLQLANTRVRAPFSGVVGKRFLDRGAFATANRSVFTLVDLSTIKTIVSLPDKDAVYVRPGQPTTVTTELLPGEVFQGRVARVAPLINPETGSTEAEVEISNPKGLLRPGMLVRVQIAQETAADGLLVPRAALVQSQRGTHLFVVAAGQDSALAARQVAVRVLGVSEAAGPERVAVDGSLTAGDRVVTLGQENLRDGAPVRLAAPPTPAARADTSRADTGPAARAAARAAAPARAARTGTS